MNYLRKLYGCKNDVLRYLQHCINLSHDIEPIYLNINPFAELDGKLEITSDKPTEKVQMGNYVFEGKLFYLANPEKSKVFFGECELTSMTDSDLIKFNGTKGVVINYVFYPNSDSNDNDASALLTSVETEVTYFPSFVFSKDNIKVKIVNLADSIINCIITDTVNNVQLHGHGLRNDDFNCCPLANLPSKTISGILHIFRRSIHVHVLQNNVVIDNTIKITPESFWNVFKYSKAEYANLNDEIRKYHEKIDGSDKSSKFKGLAKLIFKIPLNDSVTRKEQPEKKVAVEAKREDAASALIRLKQNQTTVLGPAAAVEPSLASMVLTTTSVAKPTEDDLFELSLAPIVELRQDDLYNSEGGLQIKTITYNHVEHKRKRDDNS